MSAHRKNPTRDDWINARGSALRYAGELTTDPANQQAVISNARPIIRWLSAATDRTDLNARLEALSQHNRNRVVGRYRADDDPEKFLYEAADIYAEIRGRVLADVAAGLAPGPDAPDIRDTPPKT